MTRLTNIAIALTLALPLAANANDAAKSPTKPAAAVANMPVDVAVTELKTQAKIVELDKKDRSVVVRTPAGKLITIQVPEKVEGFSKVQVGDDLVIRYEVAVAMEIEPTSKSDAHIRERIESSDAQMAKPGSLPGVETARRVEIIANITAINRKEKTMTLRGATRTVTVAIPGNINIAKLKVGDEVHAVIVDAIMVDIENKPA